MFKTNIEWADVVWNPVTGCTKVSAGCKNCYAEAMAKRLQAMGAKGYENGFDTVVCHEDRLAQPLHWKKPQKIFVNSMGDLFHDDVPFEFIDRVFAIMALAPQHTFIVLTKRPERMELYLSKHWLDDDIRDMMDQPTWLKFPKGRSFPRYFDEWPLPNVMLGVSVENQETADERIPLLLATPAAKRFVSYEPALGGVNLTKTICLGCGDDYYECGSCPAGSGLVFKYGGTRADKPSWPIDLVIMGGESGPNARPMHPDWVRTMRNQCKRAGVSFYLKQNGEYLPVEGDPADWSDGEIPLNSDGTDCRGVEALIDDTCVKMKKVGKKLAGDLLDGVQYHEWPE